MRTLRALTVVALAAFSFPVLASTAHAHSGIGVPAGTSVAQCVVGCNMQKKGCIQSARTTALSCKQNCRATSAHTELGTCMRGCAATFGSSVGTCRADKSTCIQGCVPASPQPSAAAMSCLGTCGTDLAGCAQGVVSQAKTCIAGCRTATDHLVCLQGCASSAISGAQACATSFESCKTGCPAP